jgi:hypothetical protein
MDNTSTLKDIPFFYIISMGRSGSTLLEFILDAHPNIAIPTESRFIIHLYYKYKSKKKWSKKDKESFLNDLFKDFKFNSNWDIDKEKLKREIINSPANISFFELCKIITANYISFYPKEEIKLLGSKNPIYALWCDVLYQLNQDSKFIHLIRNPLGVVASHKKLGFKNLTYFAFRWNLMNKHIEKLKRKIPTNFLTVKYEDLLKTPEGTIQQVCDFLNIEYYPSQLTFNETIKTYQSKIIANKEEHKIKMFNSHFKNLVHPITNSFSDSWKETLTEKEIQTVCSITKKVATNYDYNTQIHGTFKLKFIFASMKAMYNYFKLRIYYMLSLSIKLK